MPPTTSTVQRGLVLLAAGRGDRLRPLTETTPKSLLPICGTPVLGRILDVVTRWNPLDLVVVTGFQSDEVSTFVAQRAGSRARCIRNDRFRDDVNILSAQLGVENLRKPEAGYLIVETDLLLLPDAWRAVEEAARGDDSFWVTCGHYHAQLTGGIAQCERDDRVRELLYRPEYDPRYEGWRKLIGILGVAPAQVAADRATRAAAIADTIRQYYMMPWVHQLASLPCRSVHLAGDAAMSFNTPEIYADAEAWFEKHQ